MNPRITIQEGTIPTDLHSESEVDARLHALKAAIPDSQRRIASSIRAAVQMLAQHGIATTRTQVEPMLRVSSYGEVEVYIYTLMLTPATLDALRQQGVQVLRTLQVDAPTPSTITARGSSARHELFATKRHTTVTSIAAGDVNRCLINEHEKITCAKSERPRTRNFPSVRRCTLPLILVSGPQVWRPPYTVYKCCSTRATRPRSRSVASLLPKKKKRWKGCCF